MEARKYIVQRIKREIETGFERAYTYYSLIATVNNIDVTKREIQLVAFTAMKGNISYSAHRTEFCEKFDTAKSTINNMISKLKKCGFLIKDSGGKVKVEPQILFDFEMKDIFLEIKLLNKPPEKNV